MMGVLFNHETGAQRSIPAQCLVGRSPTCLLRPEERFASSEHAKISWTGYAWEIRDLGSRNGTFVDGRPLKPGVPVRLASGARLGFGEQEGRWELVDAGAPEAFAVDLVTGRMVEATDRLLVLPDPSTPEVTIYPNERRFSWTAEDAQGVVREVEDQEVVTVGDCTFRLELPVMSEATPMAEVALELSSIFLRFAVSRDEERVEITVLLPGFEAKLEPREHGYVLLTLARARREDADRPEPERGWRTREELERAIRMDRNAINVAIHRARQQLAAIGVEGAAGIVQVRRGARRFGSDRFEIVELGR